MSFLPFFIGVDRAYQSYYIYICPGPPRPEMDGTGGHVRTANKKMQNTVQSPPRKPCTYGVSVPRGSPSGAGRGTLNYRVADRNHQVFETAPYIPTPLDILWILIPKNTGTEIVNFWGVEAAPSLPHKHNGKGGGRSPQPFPLGLREGRGRFGPKIEDSRPRILNVKSK